MLHCLFPLLIKSASAEDHHYFPCLASASFDANLHFFYVYHKHLHIQMGHLIAKKMVLDSVCECSMISNIFKCELYLVDIILPGNITSFSWTRLAILSWKSGNMCIRAFGTPNIPKRLLSPNEVIACPIFSLLRSLKLKSINNVIEYVS